MSNHKVGYILVASRRPSEEFQIEKLRQSGISDSGDHSTVWTDRVKAKRHRPSQLKCRDKAINALQRGDTLIVADGSCLGTGFNDIVDILTTIMGRGCVVFDASLQKELAWTSEAMEPLHYAMSAARLLQAESAAAARSRASQGHRGRPSPLDDPATLKEVTALLRAGEMTYAAIARKFDVASITVSRWADKLVGS